MRCDAMCDVLQHACVLRRSRGVPTSIGIELIRGDKKLVPDTPTGPVESSERTNGERRFRSHLRLIRRAHGATRQPSDGQFPNEKKKREKKNVLQRFPVFKTTEETWRRALIADKIEYHLSADEKSVICQLSRFSDSQNAPIGRCWAPCVTSPALASRRLISS